jgi:hypothetical protein
MGKGGRVREMQEKRNLCEVKEEVKKINEQLRTLFFFAIYIIDAKKIKIHFQRENALL